MNVAVMKTKAEQAISEAFEAVAGKLPGGALVKARRAEAIGKFGALGLPHRRIEEWKYTDLRSNLKEALPPAIHDTTPLTIAELIVALGPLAHIDAYRVAFVNGQHRAELDDVSEAAGLDVTALGTALGSAPEKVASRLVGPADGDSRRHCGAQRRVHDRWRDRPRRRRRDAGKAAARRLRPGGSRGTLSCGEKHHRCRRRRNRDGHRGPCRSAGLHKGRSGQCSERSLGRQGSDAASGQSRG